MVERLFLAVTRGCLQFVIVVFPDHTHLLFLAIHAYIPELTVTLTKYYRNIVNTVNGIIKSYMCI